MSLRSKTLSVVLGAAALAAPLVARAAEAPRQDHACFLSHDWTGWTAPGDGDVLYLRVRNHDIWRVDLTPGSHVRKFGDEFLVSRVHGSDWICSPLDLSLSLSDHHGFRQPLIARGLRKLTPAEAAAIPKKDLPG